MDRRNVHDATGFSKKKKEKPNIPSSLPRSASNQLTCVCAPRLSDSAKCFDPIPALCQYQQREGDREYGMRMAFIHYLVSHLSRPPFPMPAEHQRMVHIYSTADGRRDTRGEASQFRFSSTTCHLCDLRSSHLVSSSVNGDSHTTQRYWKDLRRHT